MQARFEVAKQPSRSPVRNPVSSPSWAAGAISDRTSAHLLSSSLRHHVDDTQRSELADSYSRRLVQLTDWDFHHSLHT